jgi:endonuclease-3
MARRPSPEPVAAETPDARRRRASTILRRLRAEYPLQCGLRHENPLQLLLATILSAQCSDEMVNRVTPALFARFPDAAAVAAAGQEEVEALIGSLGLFRNKAKSLRGCCALLVAEHGGEVPRTMRALVRLPGVARKTANVVLGTAFGIAAGVVVDTHVQRLSARLGLSDQTDPVRIERDLMALLPRARWIEAGHALIWHGRRCCQARKAACERCPVADSCPRIGVGEGE